MEATIYEGGNGLVAPGDYVCSREGGLYRVVSLRGPIQTGRAPGCGDWIRALVEPADWDEITDEEADDIVCSCVIDDDEEEVP